MINLKLNNTFCDALPADSVSENYIRQVKEACFSFANPTKTANPSLIHFSDAVLDNLGIDIKNIYSDEFLNVFSGNKIYPNTKPFAMCYGGHQFGNWAGQLGDGRAINLFEISHNNKQWAIQLKGAGQTPYSRNADGLAVLRSSVREYLCSEAMYYLGVPTTRALSLILTGDAVLRDVLYDGNPAYEKGAIVARVAPSFIRFGNFEILAARNDIDNLTKLTNYTISNFFPHLGLPSKETYLTFFKEVVEKTIEMIINWERVGFVHGVMNTDNMSILGLTIDYGPYGWLENYDPNWTPNTTDSQFKRYRFGNQADIALWNLYQLANALFLLINDVKLLEEVLNNFESNYNQSHYRMMCSKLGLNKLDNNLDLITSLKQNMADSQMDMTLFYRKLSDFDYENISEFVKLISEFSYTNDFYKFENNWKNWLETYASAIKKTNFEDRKKAMNKVNPKFVLRNYMAQLAIDAANEGDYSILEAMFEMLKKPYDEQPENQKWFAKRPNWAINKVGCSMLSCSS